MSDLSWEDVLKREDLVGGDIETVEDGFVYRGPLSAINRKGDLITFESPWCARMDPREGVWKKWDITSCFVNVDVSTPHDAGEGRVTFNMFMLGRATLFPKGGSKLDPAKVQDLKVDD